MRVLPTIRWSTNASPFPFIFAPPGLDPKKAWRVQSAHPGFLVTADLQIAPLVGGWMAYVVLSLMLLGRESHQQGTSCLGFLSVAELLTARHFVHVRHRGALVPGGCLLWFSNALLRKGHGESGAFWHPEPRHISRCGIVGQSPRTRSIVKSLAPIIPC